MKKKIKNQDIFGHKVTLNFNRSGDQFATLPGGLVSIIVKAILALFLITKIQDVYTRGNNSYGFTT